MSKESFKQPIKKEPPIKEMKEKLDKAEKMVEEVEERWKDKIEEFEMVEKSVKELKKLWEENEEKVKGKFNDEVFLFFSSLPLPETSSFLLERISNKFLKEFDWKKFKKGGDLDLFLSVFLNKNTKNYISSQKEKGIEEENIKPIEVHLNVKELPVLLGCLGYQNPKKLHLIIEGDCGWNIGERMQGGKIIVKGNCGSHTGLGMQDGKIIVEKNCGKYTGERMQGGEIVVEGNCDDCTGDDMQGGELNIKREVKSFFRSAFYSYNHGTIIWKGIKIWENGNWTKEGKEMWEKGEIPVE